METMEKQGREEEEDIVLVGPLLRRLFNTEQSASLHAGVRLVLSSSLIDSYLSDCECNSSTNNLSNHAQLNWL